MILFWLLLMFKTFRSIQPTEVIQSFFSLSTSKIRLSLYPIASYMRTRGKSCDRMREQEKRMKEEEEGKLKKILSLHYSQLPSIMWEMAVTYPGRETLMFTGPRLAPFPPICEASSPSETQPTRHKVLGYLHWKINTWCIQSALGLRSENNNGCQGCF